MSDSWRPKQSNTGRTASAVETMVPGTIGGRIASAGLIGERDRQQDGSGNTLEAIFSWPGPVEANIESPPYINWSPLVELGSIIASSSSSPTGPSTISIMVNTVQVATITIPSGARQTAEILTEDITLDYGDKITVKATSVGTGLSGVTLHILMSDD